MLTIGSLFTGAGMLDRAAASTFGARTLWVSDIDKGACKVLAHRYPDAPNLGDITAIDWATVPRVDIITGGSPCQDLSTAGRRAGMKPGTRSGLWESMREAIATIKPSFVVWENVQGALSAEAASELEHCPGCMGDSADRGPVLRALGRILGDLADLGLDAEWYGLPASDIGACHRRFRVFVLAYAHGAGRGEQWRAESVRAELAAAQRSGGAAARDRLTYDRMARRSTSETVSPRDAAAAVMAAHSLSSTRMERGFSPYLSAIGNDPTSDLAEVGEDGRLAVDGGANPMGMPEDRHGVIASTPEVGMPLESSGAELGPQLVTEGAGPRVDGVEFGLVEFGVGHGSILHPVDTYVNTPEPITLLPTPTVSDTNGAGAHGTGGADLRTAVQLLPTPTAVTRDRSSEELERRWIDGKRGTRGRNLDDLTAHIDWGDYAEAIARHEQAWCVPAPEPTEEKPLPRPTLNRHGNPRANPGRRLSAAFVEWMMMQPAGWITDTPGVTRNEALKLCGNGVVTPQAEHALRVMLARIGRAAA